MKIWNQLRRIFNRFIFLIIACIRIVLAAACSHSKIVHISLPNNFLYLKVVYLTSNCARVPSFSEFCLPFSELFKKPRFTFTWHTWSLMCSSESRLLPVVATSPTPCFSANRCCRSLTVLPRITPVWTMSCARAFKGSPTCIYPCGDTVAKVGKARKGIGLLELVARSRLVALSRMASLIVTALSACLLEMFAKISALGAFQV